MVQWPSSDGRSGRQVQPVSAVHTARRAFTVGSDIPTDSPSVSARPLAPIHLPRAAIPCLQPLLNAKDALLQLPGNVSSLAAAVKPLTDLGSQLTQLPAAVQVGLGWRR